MPGTLTLLGTGTCILEEERAASSVLVELPGLRLVFDLGRGVAARIATRGLRQDDLRHVVFSHFHPDHVTDLLPYLQGGSWSPVDPRTADLHLWGPPGLEVQMMRLLSLFEPDWLVRRERFAVHLHEVAGQRFEIEGHPFEWIDLPPAGNHGLGFTFEGCRVVLTGDAASLDELAEALSGCRLAIFDSGHLRDDEIVELAVRSGAGTLVASHLYRELDAATLSAEARARGWLGSLVVGRDGMELPLPS